MLLDTIEISQNFEKYTTQDNELLYISEDIHVKYRYVYLEGEDSQEPIKSDWTDLRPHEFSIKNNARILKTTRKVGAKTEVTQDLPKNELDEYFNLPIKEFIFLDEGEDNEFLTLSENELLKKAHEEADMKKKREAQIKEAKERIVQTIRTKVKECIVSVIKNENKNNPYDDKALSLIVNKELDLDLSSSFIANIRRTEDILFHRARRLK